jgi:hypothetical protein
MEQQSLTSFVYNTLTLEDSFSIRLINLHPATEVTSDLRCDITHIDLLGDVAYHPPSTQHYRTHGAVARSRVRYGVVQPHPHHRKSRHRTASNTKVDMALSGLGRRHMHQSR